MMSDDEAKYELMVLIDASLPEDERRDVVNDVERELIDLDLEIVSDEEYDVRPLAYNVEGASRGHYHLFELNVPEGNHDDIQERMNLVENVLRYLFVRKRVLNTEEEEEEELEVEAEDLSADASTEPAEA